jgi:hypothetical protein
VGGGEEGGGVARRGGWGELGARRLIIATVLSLPKPPRQHDFACML